MREIKLESMTIDELIATLQNIKKNFYKKNPDTEVYIASDEEGNSYGSIKAKFSFGFGKLKNGKEGIFIYPFNQYQDDEVYQIDEEELDLLEDKKTLKAEQSYIDGIDYRGE
jgi:hypothetical protein